MRYHHSSSLTHNIQALTTSGRLLNMGICKITKTYLVVAAGLTTLVVNQLYITRKDYVRYKLYSSPGSITAVINTAKMGTSGLHRTFSKSWKCKYIVKVDTINTRDCKDGRHSLRTHDFKDGSKYIQDFREEHPEGQCLISTALRSPTSWFGSMYLQTAKQNWKPKEEMIQDYREYLEMDDFHMLYKVLPDLLKEFNAGTLAQQVKIMDDNGGYSLIPAPATSALAGCDLLFLRMEQSDQWPDIFHMLDPEFRNIRGTSTVQQHVENSDQIDAIASYELTSEEKMNIYNRKTGFIREWFDAYGYIDGVDDESTKDGAISKVVALNL